MGWFEYVEPIATAIATGVAIYAAVDARRSAAQQGEQTKRQSLIAQESMLLDYHKAIGAWADECIDWMAQAQSMTFLDPEKMLEGAFFSRRAECLWHLSALTDRGRLFFPNKQAGDYGVGKPGAFVGLSHAVIDQLKAVYRDVGQLHSTQPGAKSAKDVRDAIVICRRDFVTEIQKEVNPQERQRRLQEIISASST